MKFVSLALAIAGVAIAAPVLSQNPGKQSEPRSEEASEEEAEQPAKICRSIRTDPSSRRKQRVCMTRDQWREFNRGH